MSPTLVCARGGGATPGPVLEVRLADAASAPAAIDALASMASLANAWSAADGTVVRLAVARREGAVMEAAHRLRRAGIRTDDLAVHDPASTGATPVVSPAA